MARLEDKIYGTEEGKLYAMIIRQMTSLYTENKEHPNEISKFFGNSDSEELLCIFKEYINELKTFDGADNLSV